MNEAATEHELKWIPALEAAVRSARRFGGLTNAKQALALGLRESILSAAAAGWLFTEYEKEVQPEEVTAGDDELLIIDTKVFSQSSLWESDRLGWDWDIGAFDIETADASYAFLDVHFRSSEVDLLDPTNEVLQSVAPATQGISKLISPRARRWDWERAFADLVVIAHHDGLAAFGELTRRGNQQNLEKWFEDWFRSNQLEAGASVEDVPSEAECRIRARYVVGALRRRAASD